MSKMQSLDSVSPTARARFEMQGFTGYSDRDLASFGPWLRLVPASIAGWTLVATIVGSPLLFLAFVPFMIAGILLPHHPFDATSNWLRGHAATPIPRTPAQRRFSYAFASAAMLVAARLFAVDPTVGRVLGGLMVVMAAGTAATQLCMPAWLWGRGASIVRRMRGEGAAGQRL